jgi:hypothetical protein
LLPEATKQDGAWKKIRKEMVQNQPEWRKKTVISFFISRGGVLRENFVTELKTL